MLQTPARRARMHVHLSRRSWPTRVAWGHRYDVVASSEAGVLAGLDTSQIGELAASNPLLALCLLRLLGHSAVETVLGGVLKEASALSLSAVEQRRANTEPLKRRELSHAEPPPPAEVKKKKGGLLKNLASPAGSSS